MKKFLVLLLFILVSCNKEASKETLPPVEVITPTTPSVPKSEAAYTDKDCGNTVPENFASMVKENVKTKTYLMQHNSNLDYWAAFFKALAKAESCFKQNMRYVESGLGKDAVTGQQNTSEGYFQMSYQDQKFHGCKFDWSKDKSLATSSLSKTIFNIEAQIECAAIVLNKQLTSNKDLFRAYYWSVLDSHTTDKNRKAAHTKFKKYLATEGF